MMVMMMIMMMMHMMLIRMMMMAILVMLEVGLMVHNEHCTGHNGGGNGDTGHNGGDYLVSLTISTGRSSSSSPFI